MYIAPMYSPWTITCSRQWTPPYVTVNTLLRTVSLSSSNSFPAVKFSRLHSSRMIRSYSLCTGVAELGGPGGPWPPQKFEWVGQGMFWPPQNFDLWSPQNGRPVVKLFAKMLLSTLKCAKFSKIFRLRRAYMGRTYSSCDFVHFQSKFLYLVILFST